MQESQSAYAVECGCLFTVKSWNRGIVESFNRFVPAKILKLSLATNPLQSTNSLRRKEQSPSSIGDSQRTPCNVVVFFVKIDEKWVLLSQSAYAV